jgi:UDP-N-acetylglucosamine--N-acetylmuramyl-(pentapeptide) pyrophosphoryl-undecaprenol N-acetylglucosamine transferase
MIKYYTMEQIKQESPNESNPIDAGRYDSGRREEGMSWEAEKLRNSSAYQIGLAVLEIIRNPIRGICKIIPGMMKAGRRAIQRQKQAAQPVAGRAIAPHLRRQKPNSSGYLFFCVNGVGLGHLTRALAVARRLRKLVPDAPIYFLSSSHAIHLITNEGFPCYYVPAKATFGNSDTADNWNALLRWTLQPIVDQHGPLHLVYDGVYPYAGLMNCIMEHAFTRTTMIMRMRHKGGVLTAVLDQLKRFDEIIIPGEACDTVGSELMGLSAEHVDPILYLDLEELLSRDDARARLGIPPDRNAIYLQLGAGTINDTGSTLRAAIEVCVSRNDCHVVVAQSPIAGHSLDWVYAYPHVRLISDYPNARYFNAFDLAISAAGYNTYHELLHYGVPTILIPRREGLDDQVARARAAEREGAVLLVEDDTDLAARISSALTPSISDTLRKRALQCAPRNGAEMTAGLLLLIPSGAKPSI